MKTKETSSGKVVIPIKVEIIPTKEEVILTLEVDFMVNVIDVELKAIDILNARIMVKMLVEMLWYKVNLNNLNETLRLEQIWR